MRWLMAPWRILATVMAVGILNAMQDVLNRCLQPKAK
jgi:hypothetical protein